MRPKVLMTMWMGALQYEQYDKSKFRADVFEQIDNSRPSKEKKDKELVM